MTRFHERQPGLADLQREICTFGNLSLKQLHGISIREKPQARSRLCFGMGPLLRLTPLALAAE